MIEVIWFLVRICLLSFLVRMGSGVVVVVRNEWLSFSVWVR